MIINTTRSARLLATGAAILAAVSGSTIAWAGEHAVPTGEGTSANATPTAADLIQEASDLLAVGKAVKAKAILAKVSSDFDVSLTDRERSRCVALLAAAERQVRSMDAIELSLQKSEASLDAGDLRTAEAHASPVASSAKATPAQSDAANKLIAAAKERRAAIEPRVGELLAFATESYAAGRYSESKSALDAVYRSGAKLTPAQQSLVAGYQNRIVNLETERGRLFETVSAGMLQPGVVRKREDGEAAPAGEAPAAAAETVVVAATQPEAAPVVVAANNAQPADDLIAAARRYEAQELLAQADQAFEKQALNDAQAKYTRLLGVYRGELTPEQAQRATDRLNEARVKLGGAAGTKIDDVIAQIGLLKQQTLAEYNNDIAEARKALASGDIPRARDRAAQARFRINNAKQAFSEQELQTYSKEVDTLLADVAKAEGELAAAQAADRDRKLQQEAKDAGAQTAAERDRRIRENIDRVRALQQEKKYDEALQVVDQILFLDPINPTGLLLRDIISDARVYYVYNRAGAERGQSVGKQIMQNAEATIFPENIMQYPKDWPAISSKRGEPIMFAETAETRRTLAQLDRTRIPSALFNDNTLESVLNFLATVTNLSFDTDWASLEAIGVQKDTQISLSLVNQPARAILDRVLEKASPGLDITSRAGWAVNDSIVQVASEEVLRRNRIMVVYDIRDLLMEIRDKLNSPTFDLNQALQSAGGSGGGGQAPFQNNQQRQQPQEEPRRPLADRTRDIVNIITEQVDHDGWRENGGSTGFIQQLNGNLIITNTPKNHRSIEGLLSQLRKVRNMQISVEARFLQVDQAFYEQIGFDLDVYFNANNNQVQFFRNVIAANGGVDDVYASDFIDPNTGRPRRTRAVTRNWDTAPTPIPDGYPDGTPPGTAVGDAVAAPRPSDRWSVLSGQQNSNSITSSLLATPFANQVRNVAGGPALGLGGTFLDDVQVDFLIQATQADRRGVSLTAPRLTFTNGQFANVYVVQQRSYVQDLTPVTSQSSAAFDPQIGVAAEGVLMLVGGTISSDRRYVTLDIETAIADLPDTFRTSRITATVGGINIPSDQVGSFIELPEVRVTAVNTIVTVPDQGTVLLGGQRVVTEAEVESGVPVLSKIPIINRFFSNRATSKEEQTLLMLIKPTVLIQAEEEERNFPGLLDQLKTGLGN